MCAFKQRIQRSSPLPVQTEAHSGRRLCTVVFYTCRTSREGREVLSILEQIRPMRGRTSRSMHYSKRLYRRCLHRNLWFANRCGLHSATGTDYVCINEKNHILLLFFCINTIYIYIYCVFLSRPGMWSWSWPSGEYQPHVHPGIGNFTWSSKFNWLKVIVQESIRQNLRSIQWRWPVCALYIFCSFNWDSKGYFHARGIQAIPLCHSKYSWKVRCSLWSLKFWGYHLGSVAFGLGLKKKETQS